MAKLPLVEFRTLEAIAESAEDSPEVSLKSWFETLKLENPVIGAYLESYMGILGYEDMTRAGKVNHLLPAVMVYQLLKAQAAADEGIR